LKNDVELILEELSNDIKHVHQELEKPLLTKKTIFQLLNINFPHLKKSKK